MNIVDSSCWIEYFAGTHVDDLISNAYEAFKKLLIETDEDKALLAVAHMKQGHVIELKESLGEPPVLRLIAYLVHRHGPIRVARNERGLSPVVRTRFGHDG
jgi:hypothetical protein